jgi:hypothetical protein
MRGADAYNEALFSTVRLEDFVPAKPSSCMTSPSRIAMGKVAFTRGSSTACW